MADAEKTRNDMAESAQDQLGQIAIREAYSKVVIFIIAEIYKNVTEKSVPFMAKMFGFKKSNEFHSWQTFLSNSIPKFQHVLGPEYRMPFPVQNFRKSYNDVMHPQYLWRDGHIPTFRRGSFLFGPAEMQLFFISLMEYGVPFFYQDANGVSHSHVDFDPCIL